MGLSSNILWHQTKEDGFYGIIKSKKLYYSYSQERIVPEFHLEPIAFPMISVSDYPLSEISNNKWAYGDYCIGFKQSWGVKAGFSPVWYCSIGSHSLRLLDRLLEDAIKTDSKGRFGVVMALFASMKLVEAPLITKNKTFNSYRFYDEHEWRLVPYISETDKAEILPFLTEEGYLEYKKEHGSSLLDIGVDFAYDDINYIIVDKEEDIQKTREIVGNRVHIFTKVEIMENVVGIEHHDEVQPSQEQLDYEAAQRHALRLSKLAHECMEKWKKDKSSET